MGSENQFIFAKKHFKLFDGPFLEIGSKDYGNTQDLRGLFSPKGDYTGIDMSEGKGVEMVVDLTEDFEVLDKLFEGRRFGTIFCLSVLEHCEDPFKMSDNMTRLLKPGGKIFISVPFAWQFHGYPSDYWRFTYEGVKKLFPRLSFDMDKCVESSSVIMETKALTEDIGKVSIRGGSYRRAGRPLRGLSADIFKLLAKVGLFKWIFGYRHLFRPTMLDMIGELDEQR